MQSAQLPQDDPWRQRSAAKPPPPPPGFGSLGDSEISDASLEDVDEVEQTSNWDGLHAARSARATSMAAGPVTEPDAGASSSSRELPTRLVLDHELSSSARPTAASTDSDSSGWRSRGTSHMTGYEGLSEPSPEQPRLRLNIGRQVPGTRYRILRWLGEGGMGVVYAAEHVDIERRVALKILRFDLSCQPQMTRVFRDEARAATRIGSPHIVDIFDFGELPDGRLYFCMELIEGRDLVPESAESWTEPARLIAQLRQICKGLGDAHKAGIVHRDIKPENILLYSKDGRETIKLVDFGISAMLAINGEAKGNGAGTPHYMAPEQISGQEFDGRLDIYALGCTAYELLTGTPPFDCEDVSELLGKHLSEAPLPVTEVRPDREIPRALEAVIMRCLCKKPEDRYTDMADLEAALCEAQIAAGLTTPWDDLPLPDVDPERRERLLDLMPGPALPRQRRRWLWPTLAGVSTVAAVGLAIVLGRQPPATPEELDRINDLTQEALNAGAQTYYFYPPPDKPKSTFTAYYNVRQLEKLDDGDNGPGRARAEQLRKQFATTLVNLGNMYWPTAVGRDWAYEYYSQALIFDPDNESARKRNNVSEAGLARMRSKAENQGFSTDELLLMDFANIMAEADRKKRETKIKRAIRDKRGGAIRANLAKRAMVAAHRRTKDEDARGALALGQGGQKPKAAAAPKAAGRQDSHRSDAVRDELLAELDGNQANQPGTRRNPRPPIGTARGQRNPTPPGSTQNPSVRQSRSRANPKVAKQFVTAGERARKHGRRDEAERMFHKAISHDRRNARALMGLAEIYFDRGNYEEQVKFAERAVDIAPKNASYRIKLGDAYYKVLRYKDALRQYGQAAELGHRKARDRMAKVKARIGNQ